MKTRLKATQKLSKEPLLTIVTVVYNGEQFLERTILSILNQKANSKIEYVIIDGGSTDSTLDIIHKYNHVVDYWLSEPDNGIYDAMNKGIKLASGTWINFMNAGDEMIKVPDLQNANAILIYGKAKLKNRKVLSCPSKLTFDDFAYGMIICHQACFYNKKYYKKSEYDFSYELCADQKFTAEALRNGESIYVNDIVCSYLDGGFSSGSDLRILFERLRLNKEMGMKLYPAIISFLRAKLVSAREIFLRLYNA